MNNRSGETPSVNQRTIFAVSLVILLGAVGGMLYFLFQVDLPMVVAGVVAMLFTGLVVGRFYIVAKHQLL